MIFNNEKNEFIHSNSVKIIFIPEPFLFCPNCAIDTDKGAPVVKPDFFYIDIGSKGLCVFVDGPDHEKESVIKDDDEKRRWLKANGYRYIVFDYKNAPDFKDKIKQLREMI